MFEGVRRKITPSQRNRVLQDQAAEGDRLLRFDKVAELLRVSENCLSALRLICKDCGPFDHDLSKNVPASISQQENRSQVSQLFGPSRDELGLARRMGELEKVEGRVRWAPCR